MRNAMVFVAKRMIGFGSKVRKVSVKPNGRRTAHQHHSIAKEHLLVYLKKRNVSCMMNLKESVSNNSRQQMKLSKFPMKNA